MVSATSAIPAPAARLICGVRRPGPAVAAPVRSASGKRLAAKNTQPQQRAGTTPQPAAGAEAQRGRGSRQVCGAATEEAPTGSDADATIEITVDNDADPAFTKVVLSAPNRPGLLTAVTSTFRDLNLDVAKAVVDNHPSTGDVEDVFFVTDTSGAKITDPKDVANIKNCLSAVFSATAGNKAIRARPDLTAVTTNSKKDLLYTLMGMLPPRAASPRSFLTPFIFLISLALCPTVYLGREKRPAAPVNDTLFLYAPPCTAHESLPA